MTINLQFVYGAGSDTLFGGGLRDLQSKAKAKYGDRIYSPRILDWTEGATLNRLLEKWKDPTILVGHSCGCMPITQGAVHISMKPVPYLMAIAPSMYCAPVPLSPNVASATQATSWWGDFFNPFGRQLLTLSPVNNKTRLDVINTGMSHLRAPYSPLVWDRLDKEIAKALAA